MGMACELQSFSAVSATKYACIASVVEVAGVFAWWSWAKRTHVERAGARPDGDKHRFNIPHRGHVRCLVTILHQQVPNPAINTLPGPPVAFFSNLGAYFWDNKSVIWVINLLWWLCRVETREEEEEDGGRGGSSRAVFWFRPCLDDLKWLTASVEEMTCAVTGVTLFFWMHRGSN